MDSNEYERWLKAHNGAFPGFRRWLTANEDSTAALMECLADVSFSDAREVTRTLNQSDAMETPTFGEHGRLVRRMARGLAKQREAAAREQARPLTARGRLYSCRICWDGGIVMVANIWRSRNGNAAIEKFLRGTHPLPVCGVRCCCPLGGGKQPAFDPDSMFRVERFTAMDGETEAFREWWAGGHQTGNRIAAFDHFNRAE